jgi:hypothetical protein
MKVDCTITSSIINPKDFLVEILPKVKNNQELYDFVKRYSELKSLSYRDVVIIYNQILPKWLWNDWNGVQLTAPLDLPKNIPFNINFSTEWYYFNSNGYFMDKNNKPIRFYMLRVLKRLRVICPFGSEDVPWLFSDMISIYAENGIKIVEHVCAPAFSAANSNPNNNTKPYFIISSNPLKISYITQDSDNNAPIGVGNKSYTALELKAGILTSEFIKNDIDCKINCTCDKDILLQGENLDGLDPPVNNIISKVSGASYLYFSWPSWKLNSGSLGYKDTFTFVPNDANFPFTLWLDHQGGVVKSTESPLLEEFALIAGARPKVFPGWNWFSLQFFDGTQFTGYSNKPQENNLSDIKQMLKGTWSDKDGNLSWIKGSKKITKWWKSPDSGTNFAVGYEITLPGKGTYKLVSILDDQRAPQEGLEQYEGGCDILDANNKRIGMGNLECIGWPDIDQRITYIDKSLSAPLTEKEKNIIKKNLEPNMTKINIFIASVTIILTIILYFLLFLLFSKFIKKNNYYIWYNIPLAIILSILIVWILITIFKHVLCQKTWTCSLNT